MAQSGSVFSTPSNQTRASGNQNECSSATARLKSSFTAGLHDVSKLTVPTLEEDPLCCECSSCADTTRETANSANTHAKTVSCFIWDSFTNTPAYCSRNLATGYLHELEHRQKAQDDERGDPREADVPRFDVIGDPLPHARAERHRQSTLGHHREDGTDPDQHRDVSGPHAFPARLTRPRGCPHAGRRHAFVAPLRQKNHRKRDSCAFQDPVLSFPGRPDVRLTPHDDGDA